MLKSDSRVLWRFLPALLCLSTLASAAAPAKAPSALDQQRIHEEYNSGDFDKVLTTLTEFMKTHSSYSQTDSIFIAKHLAVVYTANPDTREKGKYFMYRLLEMLPSAKLLDMYVSDEIDRIFDKVREEFMARQHAFGVDTAKVSVPAKAPGGRNGEKDSTALAGPTPKSFKEPAGSTAAGAAPRKGHRTAFWIAGATGVIATGVAAYLVLAKEDEPEDQIMKVPK